MKKEKSKTEKAIINKKEERINLENYENLQESFFLLKDKIKAMDIELDNCLSSIYLVEKTIDEKLSNVDLKSIFTESQLNNFSNDMFDRMYVPMIDDVTDKLYDIVNDLVDKSDLADDARRALDTSQDVEDRVEDVVRQIDDYKDRIDDLEKELEDQKEIICTLKESIEELMYNSHG